MYVVLLHLISFCWDERSEQGVALNCDAAGVKLCEYSVSRAQSTSVVNISGLLSFVDRKILLFNQTLHCITIIIISRLLKKLTNEIRMCKTTKSAMIRLFG